MRTRSCRCATKPWHTFWPAKHLSQSATLPNEFGNVTLALCLRDLNLGFRKKLARNPLRRTGLRESAELSTLIRCGSAAIRLWRCDSLAWLLILVRQELAWNLSAGATGPSLKLKRNAHFNRNYRCIPH